MNILLWVLQVLLALHTVMGAVWKISHTAEQTMPSLKAIPQGAWMSLLAVEMLCAVGLLVPALHKPLAVLVPISAVIIAVEMLLFCGVHLASDETANSPMLYWLGVATVCGFITYGRLVLSPL